MFTTEHKLKPKPELFAILYDLKDLKYRQDRPVPIYKPNERKTVLVTALVNAANPYIKDGAGVTGAIATGLGHLSYGGQETFYDNLTYEHKYYEPKTTTKNPYNDKRTIINDRKIAYDDLCTYVNRWKQYKSEQENTLNDYEYKKLNKMVLEMPYFKYLIHVAGPDFRNMDYSSTYLDIIGSKEDKEKQWKTILRRTLETLMDCVTELKITDLYLPLISGSIYAPNEDSEYSLEVHADIFDEYLHKKHLKVNIYIVDYKQELLDKSIKYLSKTFTIEQIKS